jgi:hypothetical protein
MSGTSVYQTGWNVNGTGTEQVHLNTANLWRNTTGFNIANPGNGPLNRTGLWANDGVNDNVDNPLQTWLGFNYCLTGITGGQYYVGIAADNEFRLEIDGVTILDTFANSGLNSLSKFRTWHVYPISLTAGDHIIGLYGYNLLGTVTNPAGFGCEIYNNTLSQLTNANSINDLNVIFTSTNFVNQIIPVVKNDDEHLSLNDVKTMGVDLVDITNSSDFDVSQLDSIVSTMLFNKLNSQINEKNMSPELNFLKII